MFLKTLRNMSFALSLLCLTVYAGADVLQFKNDAAHTGYESTTTGPRGSGTTVPTSSASWDPSGTITPLSSSAPVIFTDDATPSKKHLIWMVTWKVSSTYYAGFVDADPSSSGTIRGVYKLGDSSGYTSQPLLTESPSVYLGSDATHDSVAFAFNVSSMGRLDSCTVSSINSGTPSYTHLIFDTTNATYKGKISNTTISGSTIYVLLESYWNTGKTPNQDDGDWVLSFNIDSGGLSTPGTWTDYQVVLDHTQSNGHNAGLTGNLALGSNGLYFQNTLWATMSAPKVELIGVNASTGGAPSKFSTGTTTGSSVGSPTVGGNATYSELVYTTIGGTTQAFSSTVSMGTIVFTQRYTVSSPNTTANPSVFSSGSSEKLFVAAGNAQKSYNSTLTLADTTTLGGTSGAVYNYAIVDSGGYQYVVDVLSSTQKVILVNTSGAKVWTGGLTGIYPTLNTDGKLYVNNNGVIYQY